MKTNRLPNLTSAILCIAIMAAVTHAAGAQPAKLAWPPVTKECRPWAYWWWMGSAVNKTDLTRNLELYRQAGRGGMQSVPI